MNRILKNIIACVCAVAVSFSLIGNNVLTVQASANINLTKIIDMSLSKTGIVANNSTLQKLQASTLNMLNGTASSFWDYCNANGLSYSRDSWSTYLNSDAYRSLPFALPSWALQSGYYIDWLLGGDVRGEIMSSDAVKMMLGTSIAVNGNNYTIPSNVVNYYRDSVNDVMSENGYILRKTFSPADLKKDWFFTDEMYYNVYGTILSDNQHYYNLGFAGNGQLDIKGVSLMNTVSFEMHLYKFKDTLLVKRDTRYPDVYNHLCATVVTPNDASRNDYFYGTRYETTTYPYSTYEELLNSGTLQLSQTINPYFDVADRAYNGVAFIGLFTCDGRYVKVFDSAVGAQNHNVGSQDTYIASNYTYDSSKDNSIKFSGEYYNNNSENYTYDIVQNQIDNTSNIDESVVNNIVNNYTYNTVNNFYDNSGDSDDSGDDDSNDGGIDMGGAIESLINGIMSILNFLLTLVGDVFTVLSDFLTSLYEILVGFGESFSGLSSLLGELFVFIPEELIRLLEAGVGAMVVVAVWKFIRS